MLSVVVVVSSLLLVRTLLIKRYLISERLSMGLVKCVQLKEKKRKKKM